MSTLEAGIYTINKPAGPTSFDMVRRFKKILKAKSPKKVGHFGTLDPFAEGVLLIGLNGAMKTAPLVHEKFLKTYVAEGHLASIPPRET